MKTKFILVILLLLSVPASGNDQSLNALDTIKEYFLSISAGRDFRQIENELQLPLPDKTYFGSSSYHDRRFRYDSFKGLVLQIGLKQESEIESYEKGRFSFNGDFWIIGDGREYSHCCFDDGYASIYDGPDRR